MDLDDIITRQYTNFLGVDFRGGEVKSNHSPDSKNMWRDYTDSDCIQTRPGMKLLNTFSNRIYGLFFYKLNSEILVLVHNGTTLSKWDNYPTTPATLTTLKTGLSATYSRGFIYDGIFYLLDGTGYYKYDGTTFSSVEGTIPTTTYYNNPDGSTDMDSDTDTDYIYQNVNCLQRKRRNKFISDGVSTEYSLDTTNLDTDYIVQVSTYDTTTGETETLVENTDFTVNRTTGKVTFVEAPGSDKYVYILFAKTVYDTNGKNIRERILRCTMMCEFDNRIFLTGNPDCPQAVFWSSESDPEYFSEDDRLEIGMDLAEIKALIPGNNVLWAIKETSQNSASVYYLTPTINSTYGKYYTPTGGNVSVGCVSTGINFNDDIVFFSNNGLEGIDTNSMYSEQILGHRSTYIDSKLLSEDSYEDVKITEFQGYLVVLLNSHIYLADKRKKISTGSGSTEYEWFYWELPNSINYVTEYRGELYLGNSNGGLYVLSSNSTEEITSYWTTPKDNFGYPSYTKTTNKKGAETILKKMNNDEITITSIVDDTEKKSKTLSDAKGYAVFKMKNKKFFRLQYKISSKKPFGIYSATVQGFVAGYLKR